MPLPCLARSCWPRHSISSCPILQWDLHRSWYIRVVCPDSISNSWKVSSCGPRWLEVIGLLFKDVCAYVYMYTHTHMHQCISCYITTGSWVGHTLAVFVCVCAHVWVHESKELLPERGLATWARPFLASVLNCWDMLRVLNVRRLFHFNTNPEIWIHYNVSLHIFSVFLDLDQSNSEPVAVRLQLSVW